MYVFICNRKPRSSQANVDPQYTQAIREAFKTYNGGKELLSGDLYGVIYYFHNIKTDIDTDNIPKKIWDALNFLAYKDDKIIKYSSAAQIDLKIKGIQPFDTGGIPDEIFEDFLRLIDQENNILYVEMGEFRDDMVQFGLERGGA